MQPHYIIFIKKQVIIDSSSTEGPVAKLADAVDLGSIFCGFKSLRGHAVLYLVFGLAGVLKKKRRSGFFFKITWRAVFR